MDFALVIQSLAVYALPVLFAITVHEAAHGYAARYLGDDTAWKLGRVTLNPVPHIDLLGTIVLPLVMYLASAGGMLFGYAKPVPVRYGNLRHPKRDMVWVALAGPASNLLQAVLWGALYYAIQALGVQEVFFYGMCKAGVSMNIGLCVLNLFPLPPLDGGRILTGLLPMRQAMAFSRIEPYGFFIVLALIYLRILDGLWMQPVSAIAHFFLNLVLSPLAALAR
jgi:Zn-dependent protease